MQIAGRGFEILSITRQGGTTLGGPPFPESSRRKDAVVVAALCLIYFVLVFEHELSPYVVLVQFVC